MLKLHITKFGKGPNLILLHGWGSSSKIWQTSIDSLSPKFCTWCIDLPGHGESHAIKWDYSIEQGVQILAQSLPPKCSIIGWSLGGLIAQLFASQFPERVTNLMLIASTAKFISSQDWTHGMQKDIFINFTKQFSNDPQKTLQQFSALQVLNTNSSKQTLSTLVDALSNQQKHIKNIQWGLHWLQHIDLRADPILSTLPIKLVHGELDAVSSINAAKQTASIWKNTDLISISNAGHAPFVSHTHQFLEQIEAWC